MDPQYLPLKPKPGAWRNGTRYEAGNRWFDVNLVRWTNGRLRPVGGWQRFTTTPMGLPARGLHGWRANNQTRWLAIGTGEKLVIHDNTSQQDVTPAGFAAGRGNSVYGLGWGAGAYGMDAYGTTRTTSGIVLDAATWSFDNFGEVLIGCCSGDGKIYEWNPQQWSLAGGFEKAAALTNAPVGVLYAFVTDERHVVALGTEFNPRRVSWSDRENRNVWASFNAEGIPTTAGNKDLATAGKLVCAAKWQTETLLFTDCDLHKMKFVGTPFVYGFNQVAENCGIVGPLAVVSISDRVAWMSPTGFQQYDGVVTKIPCDVQEYVFQDINILQGAKIVAGHNSGFGEVWWMYPSKDSVENDRYVIWNYQEGWWSFGQLGRTAWLDSGVWTHIVAAGVDGHLYQHEQGWTDSGVSRIGQVYAESGTFEIGRGERLAEVRQLLPDDCEDEHCVQVSFKLRDAPRAPVFAVAGPYQYDQTNGFKDVRFAARQIEMRVEATTDGDFHIGTLRADVAPGSGR